MPQRRRQAWSLFGQHEYGDYRLSLVMVALAIVLMASAFYELLTADHIEKREVFKVALFLFFAYLFGRRVPREYATHRGLNRIRHGRCAHCGYDLRGSGRKDTCPECGEPITPKPRDPTSTH